MLKDLEHFIIVYNPGYAGNFLLRLFSLGEEVVPQLPVNLLVKNDSRVYSSNDRLDLYSFSTIRSQYMNWQKFHRDWIDFSHYEKLNCILHPNHKHIVFAMHVPELEIHKPVLQSIQNIKYFYVDLDLEKYSSWIESAQQDLNFKYRIDEKSKYQNLVDCAVPDQLINLTAMLESSDKFLQEYCRICAVMKITPVESQALVLYQEWYDARVAYYEKI
jgi:hypothetical protein